MSLFTLPSDLLRLIISYVERDATIVPLRMVSRRFSALVGLAHAEMRTDFLFETLTEGYADLFRWGVIKGAPYPQYLNIGLRQILTVDLAKLLLEKKLISFAGTSAGFYAEDCSTDVLLFVIENGGLLDERVTNALAKRADLATLRWAIESKGAPIAPAACFQRAAQTGTLEVFQSARRNRCHYCHSKAGRLVGLHPYAHLAVGQWLSLRRRRVRSGGGVAASTRTAVVTRERVCMGCASMY